MSARLSNAERILKAVDSRLDSTVEFTLFGRAALQLGFDDPPRDYALSRDVDAVFWLGQAEELLAASNFWQVVDGVNRELADQELYITHFFEEDQVILTSGWRRQRVRIPGAWRHFELFRLGNEDLFLLKLMRDDPIDIADARFIIDRARFTRSQVESVMGTARVPAIPEIREQFELCGKRILAQL